MCNECLQKKKGKDKKAFYPIRSRLIYSMGLVNAICGTGVIVSYIFIFWCTCNKPKQNWKVCSAFWK